MKKLVKIQVLVKGSWVDRLEELSKNLSRMRYVSVSNISDVLCIIHIEIFVDGRPKRKKIITRIFEMQGVSGVEIIE